MVTYIKSDLEFILKQIQLAEAHAAGTPLYGPGGLIPTYNLSWGLRAVDGSNNHLLPGQERWGASDTPFNELMNPTYRTITMMMDPDGPNGPAPTMPVSMPYTPGNDVDGPGTFAGPGDVIDPGVRTISNLIVDQTLANPVAIMIALQRGGVLATQPEINAVTGEITAAFKAIAPLFQAVNQAQVAQAAAEAALNANPTDPGLIEAKATADANLATARLNLADGNGALDTLLTTYNIAMDGQNISLTNAAPDEGLSAPFNSWFTLFGQFFDHGLDLVNKGGSGTVMIPLSPDDPLYIPGSPTNFMVLTRATTTAGPDGQWNTIDDVRPINTTTAYVDQNQTYTSHPSHQVFLRQYVMTADGPVSTGKLIEGANGGMANWGEVKAQARDLLGIQLTDLDVGTVPLLRTDAYGEFIRGPNGFPLIVTGIGLDGIPNTADDTFIEGDPDANGGLGVSLATAVRTNHAFLADIAHFAVPDGIADGDTEVGGNIPEDGFYDNELLDAHFIAGDGRANENIGLTAVHHVFHSEHNRLVDHTKATVLATNDLAFINEWLAVDVQVVPTTPEAIAALVWDGERIFQAAKFGTEMQYQHLVFEEFARKIQPNINVFLVPDGFDTMMDPSIFAEFAHVVYRFGHSMLTESIDQFDENFNPNHISLIQGFLNPGSFNGPHGESDHDLAAGAIIRGMTRQVGNEIDEFITSALRNNLLGLPLDLATINLARGRDVGVPSLNEARRTFFNMTNQDALLTPYSSWVDFAGNLKHEASIINFVAAYGTHPLITGETTVEGKRDAAMTLIFGEAIGKFAAIPGFVVPADATDFLNATGAYAGGSLGGLENIDLWIGGLAEKIMPFGGMLGSTFNFVFEAQMELLQSGDRFYYLQRLDGLHLFGEMENNSFAAMMMRNTDATHLPSDVFSTPGLILEIDRTRQYNPGLGEEAGADGILEDDPLTTEVNESADNLGVDPTGTSILTKLVVRDNPATAGADTNYLKYNGGDHVVLGGTDPGNAFNPSGKDILIAGIGDDTVYGDGGNDVIEGGFGNDILNGGDGDDIIKDMGGDDNIKAGKGNDVVHAGPGLDLVMGNDGHDFVFLGTDMGSEVFAGTGNDYIYGNRNAERILGNEGNDWIETGTFDGAPGDNFDEVFAHDGIDGHDVFLGDGGFDEFIGEGGDDIMVGSTGRGKMAGMSGFDWATYKDSTFGINADLSRPIVFDEAPTLPANAALDEYASMEGLSGSKFNDVLGGSNALGSERLPFDPNAPAGTTGQEGYRGSQVTKESLQLISGLAAVLGLTTEQVNALASGASVFNAGDIILGGDGSDIIQGNAGDDIIDGDKWLNVRIAVHAQVGEDGGVGAVLEYHNSMTTLAAKMFSGEINPGQLRIHREITTAGADNVADIDTARFQGARGEYTFGATADGQVIVSHAVEDSLDGTDRLRNIERVQFADGGSLNIIVGTPNNDTLNGTPTDDLMLGLAGADTLNGGAGNDILVGGAGGTSAPQNFADNFDGTPSYTDDNGTLPFTGGWVETGDLTTGNVITGGQIRISNNTLQFRDDDNDTGNGGAEIQRVLNLTGATNVTVSFSYNESSFDAGEILTIDFSPNGQQPFQTIRVLDGSSGSNSVQNFALTGNFTDAAVIRFRVSGTNNNSNGGDNITINDLVIRANMPAENAGVDTLNGGLGDDTYSFSLGDGNDVINEAVNATSGGSADRISILATQTGLDVDGLPVLTLASLNAQDNNGGTNNGDLVISYAMPTGPTTSVTPTITVAGHFTGTNAQTGVERINFNGAIVNGYALGSDDYLISRADPNNRDSGGVNLSASTVNNFIVGEQGTSDVITGGLANDLIFGATGNNDLIGNDGDDLLIGGSGNDDLDARLNAAGDDFAGALGADTMVGGAGNDTYGVDDLLDIVVEALNEGTDTVGTFMTELSIANMANVENLTYRGADAGAFVGTGNTGNNTITGGDLSDTLSGLAGADRLVGGLGADNMNGGEGNDTYVVDDAGDVVNESTGLPADVDTVEASISYTLAAGVENLTLIGGADINGNGNAQANVINGNDGINQLFGGAGDDVMNGDDDNDVLDGGLGKDVLNGGNGNDTVIGGAGDDTINVGSGNDTIRYSATGFGNDTITGFDANPIQGGQDLIDLRGLGLTAAMIGTANTSRIHIQDIEDGAVDDTLITIRDAVGATVGTIRIEEVENTNFSATDFIFDAAAPTPFGAPTEGANTITGNAAANTINGLGGNDTLNGAGGDDVINGGEGADTLNGGDGNDTLSGGIGSNTGSALDQFGTGSFANNNGSLSFSGNWVDNDPGQGANAATSGDITVSNGRLQFNQNVDGGESIERTVNLTGATSATVTFTYEDDNLNGGQTVIVQARNLTNNTWVTLTNGTLGTGGNGTFNFTATLAANQIGANTAIRFLTTGDGSNWDTGDNFYVDNFAVNATIPNLNAGVDTINGDAGDDTVVWNANASGPTDGRDLVDGGTEGAAGDTFSIIGNDSAETYRIYTRAAWLAVAGNLASSLAAGSEIIVTRNGSNAASIIAELTEIEEIRVNGADPAGSGNSGGDTFEVIGDFSGTSLRLNTITIDGDAGDDTIDISALSSAHRIVFRSNGGHDTILGTLRPEDVIELGDGADPASYTSTVVDGVTTLSNGEHSVSYRATGSGPQIGDDDEDEDDDEDDHDVDDDDDLDDEDDHDEDDDGSAPVSPGHVLGTGSDDVLLGTSGGDLVFGFAGTDYIIAGAGVDVIRAGTGNDFADGEAGRDILFGDDGNDDLFGGDDDDMIYGDAGNDRLFGQNGNDLIDAGDGNDSVFGGSGNDMFAASHDDDNDTYYGGDISGDAGVDTLDMGFLTVDVDVDLGTGVNGRGSAVSSQSGTDTLYGVENVVTGSGNDRIVMSNAVNVVDGGDGEDVFVFGSTTAAHGDTIRGFEAGDKIDLSGVDANVGTAGNDTFTLQSGQAATAPGQIVVTHETREDGEYTVVSGNTAGDGAPEFRVNIAGHHVLTGSDFNL